VLSRKLDEQLVIGTDLIITLTEIKDGKVKLGITAPQDVSIRRGELTGESDAAMLHSQWAADRTRPPDCARGGIDDRCRSLPLPMNDTVADEGCATGSASLQRRSQRSHSHKKPSALLLPAAK